MSNPLPFTQYLRQPRYGDVDLWAEKEFEAIERSINSFWKVEWRDLVGQLTVRRAAGAGVPVWTQIGSTGFYFYKFAVDDDIQVTFHVDHDFAVGTSMFFHAHWFKDGTNVQPVKWQFKVAYAHGHQRGAFDFTSPTTDTVQVVPATDAYTHQISELAVGMDLSYEVDGLIHVNLKRITNGGTDNTDGIYLMTSDAHYQCDRYGTLNRSPDFYQYRPDNPVIFTGAGSLTITGHAPSVTVV